MGMNTFVRAFLVVVLAAVASFDAASQIIMADEIRIQSSTGKTITIQEPSGLTNNVIVNLPSTTATLGQAFTISSVSGSQSNLVWQTSAKNFTNLASRLGALTNTNQGVIPATRCSVTVDANRTYRVQGWMLGGRQGTNTTPDDGVKISASLPSVPAGSSNAIQINIRCFDCPAPSSSLPAVVFPSGADVTSVTSAVLDPNTTVTNANGPFAYQIDGIIQTGSTSGTFIIWLTDSGIGTLGSFMNADSFVVLTELN